MSIRALLTALILLASAGGAPAQTPELPREVIINGVEFVHVPAGWFWHAIPDGRLNEDNRLSEGIREVRIWQDGFYIAKYEARARDFVRFMNAEAHEDALSRQYDRGASEGCSARRDDKGSYFLVQPEADLPVTHLSWNLANRLAQWMGFRLPTEAEWVKAARGTDHRHWPWGNEYPDDTFAGYDSGTPCHPVPVNMFPNGKSPYGAYGMSGGVYEYVDGWYNANYYTSLRDGDRNPKQQQALPARSDTSGQIAPLKILKGGRWASPANAVTIYAASNAEPDFAFICYGARFAIDEAGVSASLASGAGKVLAQ